MIYLQLFFEFFKAGLFAIGGGLATIPFLTDIGQRTGWFTSGELANMIAISESTPGPMGVNMATYVGFHTGGIAGGVIATLGLGCPSILVILVIAGFLKKFRESRGVDAVFYGIRPASTALIAAALAEVCSIALLNLSAFQTGGAAALFCGWYYKEKPAAGLTVFLFFCILTVVTFMDMDTMEIEDGCWIAVYILAAAACFTMPETSLISRLIGIVCVSVPMLLLTLAIPGAFGGGDM